MDKQLIIGLDGGGTNTTCILFDSNGFTVDTVYDKGSNLYVFKDDAIQRILINQNVGAVITSSPSKPGIIYAKQLPYHKKRDLKPVPHFSLQGPHSPHSPTQSTAHASNVQVVVSGWGIGFGQSGACLVTNM